MSSVPFRVKCAGRLFAASLLPLTLVVANVGQSLPSDPSLSLLPELSGRLVTSTMARKQVQKTMRLDPIPGAAASHSPTVDGSKGRLRLGVHRKFSEPALVDRTTVPETDWLVLPDHSRLWSAEISAEGARGLRLDVKGIKLPPGVRFVVGKAGDPSAQPVVLTEKDLAGAGEVWLPTVFSDRVIFECQAPPEVDVKSIAFSLDGVSHLYSSPADVLQKALACQNDATCYPEWKQTAAGVARITFVEDGSSYMCSGSLLAGNDPLSVVSYFLTAKHCIVNQTVASTLEVYWLYQTSKCGGLDPDFWEIPQTRGGADFVFGSFSNDLSLLRLRRTPPAGVYYLNWTSQPLAGGESVVTIHHPNDEPSRISFGRQLAAEPAWWKIRWNSGVTEEGSSGAPLFNLRQEVVGQLFGGSSSCSNPTGVDSFGRLDVSYPDLIKWLGPGSSGGPPPPLIAVHKGKYRGIFGSSNQLSATSSGAINFEVTSTSGSLSGSIKLNTGTYAFSGKFSSTGRAIISVPRTSWLKLTLDLQVDANDRDDVGGTIGDGNWLSDLVVHRAVYNSLTNIAPQNGQYTLAFPGGEGQGSGFASITINKSGSVTLTGKMPDGTAWTAAGKMAKTGEFPFWVPLYIDGRGMAYGLLSFAGDQMDPHGHISWIRPTLPALYPGEGFTRELEVAGSRYSSSMGIGSLFATNASHVILSGAGLLNPLNYIVQLRTPSKAVTSSSPVKVTVSFSTNGTFSAQLSNSPELGTKTLQGAVLQSEGMGLGYFKYQGLSGTVQIAP